MRIIYNSKKIENEFTDIKSAVRKYGPDVGKSLLKLSNFIENSKNLRDIYKMPQYRVHALKGNRKNQYSITPLKGSKYRVIVYPLNEELEIMESVEDENLMLVKCIIIKIVEVSDHYE